MSILLSVLILISHGYGYTQTVSPGVALEVRGQHLRGLVEYRHTSKEDTGDGYSIKAETAARIGSAWYGQPTVSVVQQHTSAWNKTSVFPSMRAGYDSGTLDVYGLIGVPVYGSHNNILGGGGMEYRHKHFVAQWQMVIGRTNQNAVDLLIGYRWQ